MRFSMTEFTDQEKLKEIEQEIDFRRFVYGKKVKAGKMKLEIAQRKIQIMLAIRDDYQKTISGDLFWSRK